jgi:hypothetical protein
MTSIDATPIVRTLSGAVAPRLNVYDGLFLRATHLHNLQKAATDRIDILARSGGSGVVEGLTVTLDRKNSQVVFAPGTAISPRGMVLSLAEAADLPLPVADLQDVTGDIYRVWEIVIAGVEEYTGDESVFGTLCCDPCTPDQAHVGQPFIELRVQLSLRELLVDLPSYDLPSDVLHLWSRIASGLFAAEQRNSEVLIPPVMVQRTPMVANPDLRVDEWNRESRRGTCNEASLGVLWFEPLADDVLDDEALDAGIVGQWRIDQWMARRERTETAPKKARECCLGLRPFSVFDAQIQQFHAQLGTRTPSAAGIRELPPVGVVQLEVGNESRIVKQDVQDAFGAIRVRRVVRCSPQIVPTLIADSQHHARIGANSAEVVVWVPSISNEQSPGWVVFTRYEADPVRIDEDPNGTGTGFTLVADHRLMEEVVFASDSKPSETSPERERTPRSAKSPKKPNTGTAVGPP